MSGITETVEFIKKCDHFFIATLDENEQPRVRPFSLIFEADGKIIIGTGTHKNVYKQFQGHPQIEISAYNNSTLKWVRLNGKAIEDTKPEYVKKAFESDIHLKDIYNEKTGLEMVLYHIDKPHSTIYSFTDNPVTLI